MNEHRDVDKVKHALGVEISTGIFRAGEYETPTPNLAGILTGDMGHGVDQFKVTHDRASP